MPRKKPERVLQPGEDGFTMEMRKRLKELKLKEERHYGEKRPVKETKIDDLIAKEAEDATINGLYTMWFIDKEADKARAEIERPDVQVLRRRYEESMEKLNAPLTDGGKPAKKEKEEEAEKGPVEKRGFLELTNVQDIDELMERARQREAAKAKPAAEPPAAEQPAEEAREDTDKAERIAYLEALQKRYRKEDAISRRVQKSPEQRKLEYEETKVKLYATTAALGVLGTVVSELMYSTDVAFSFALGSLCGLLYLSGLSSYADSAETLMGQAMGGRRLVTPVILVLLVVGWPKIEAQVPEVAALGLHPQLLPAILGFFMYSAGKVVSSVLPSGSPEGSERGSEE